MNVSQVGTPRDQSMTPPQHLSQEQEHFEGFLVLLSLKPIFIPLYALLTLVGVSGNLLLILVIARTKRLHNATNFLLGNLALSDLLVCLTCVPISAAFAFEPRGWVYGALLCYLVALLQPATVHVSVLSLTAIALDRYVVVAYPIRRRVAVRSCALTAGFIWIASAALACPAAVNTVYIDFRTEEPQSELAIVVCEELWTGLEDQRLAYSCAMVIVSYLLPLLAVSASYCAISLTLRGRVPPGGAHCTVNARRTWHQKRRKTFRLLVMSVGTFALCWLPLQVFNLIRDLDPEVTLVSKRYFNVIQLCCHWVAMSSTCWNPFIYASLHHKFARAVRHRCWGGLCLARPQRAALARAAASCHGGGGRSMSRSPMGMSSLSSKSSRFHTPQPSHGVVYSLSAGSSCAAARLASASAAVALEDSPGSSGGRAEAPRERRPRGAGEMPEFTPPGPGPARELQSPSLCGDKFP
ncbi:prolactin-releasing peptide receptor-like [Lampetra fluviatilis]